MAVGHRVSQVIPEILISIIGHRKTPSGLGGNVGTKKYGQKMRGRESTGHNQFLEQSMGKKE